MLSCLNDFHNLDSFFNEGNNVCYYKFNNLVGLSNYEYIHPVKQKKIREIVDLLLNDPIGRSITDIIIFGSSTSLFCSSFSDIDIMVLGDFLKFYPSVNLHQFGEIDLFGYNKKEFVKNIVSNDFYGNIWAKGVKVYEQLSASC